MQAQINGCRRDAGFTFLQDPSAQGSKSATSQLQPWLSNVSRVSACQSRYLCGNYKNNRPIRAPHPEALLLAYYKTGIPEWPDPPYKIGADPAHRLIISRPKEKNSSSRSIEDVLSQVRRRDYHIDSCVGNPNLFSHVPSLASSLSWLGDALNSAFKLSEATWIATFSEQRFCLRSICRGMQADWTQDQSPQASNISTN